MSRISRYIVLALTLIAATPGGALSGEILEQATTHQPPDTAYDSAEIVRHELSFGGGGLDVTSLDTRQMLAPAVALRFRLDQTQLMRLEILDCHGRLVRTLAQGLWAAGTHDLAWQQDDEDGQLVETGIYLARLIAADEDEEVGRLALVP